MKSEQLNPPVLPSNTIAIQADTTILWNGVKVDSNTFERLCRIAGRQRPQPEMHIKPDGLAKYDAVAKILGEMQKAGATNIGFTGIDSGR